MPVQGLIRTGRLTGERVATNPRRVSTRQSFLLSSSTAVRARLAENDAMSKKSKFQPRIEHYTLSGKVDPLVHRSFREPEDVFEYIQSQIRKELGTPRKTLWVTTRAHIFDRGPIRTRWYTRRASIQAQYVHLLLDGRPDVFSSLTAGQQFP